MAPSKSPFAASSARMASSRVNPSSVIFATVSCDHRELGAGGLAGRILIRGADEDEAADAEDVVAAVLLLLLLFAG